jgi:hypothetical protein
LTVVDVLRDKAHPPFALSHSTLTPNFVRRTARVGGEPDRRAAARAGGRAAGQGARGLVMWCFCGTG